MKDKSNLVLYCFGGIVIIWLALLVAPYVSGGLIEIIEKLPEKMNTPFEIEFCKDSLKTIFIFLFAYILGIGVYVSTRKNYRRGEEYGSAIWGKASEVNKKYSQKPQTENKILTQNVKIGLNVKPNILQCNCSFVTLDPKRRNCARYRATVRKRGI